jgi:DNA-binding MarR family transcriptional regulator
MYRTTRMGRRAVFSRKTLSQTADIHGLDTDTVRVLAALQLIGEANAEILENSLDLDLEDIDKHLKTLEKKELVRKVSI